MAKRSLDIGGVMKWEDAVASSRVRPLHGIAARALTVAEDG